ncbi:hypothetical protein ACFL3F_03015 [Planctomycetota bacterium]
MCQANLRQWGLVWSMYLNENGEKFSDMLGHDWMDDLKSYYADSNDILFCPMTRKNQRIAWRESVRYSVIVDNNGDPVGSYALNEWIYNSNASGGGRAISDYWRHARHKGMNNIPVMGDAAWRSDAQPNDQDLPPEYEGQPRVGVNSSEMRNFCIPRHGNAINVLFMDWSSRQVGLKALWRLKWSQSFNTNAPSPEWPDWMAGFSDK